MSDGQSPDQRMKSLLGKRVIATLADGQTLATGIMVAVSSIGECIIQDDSGEVWRCYPMMKITEA